MNVLEQLDRDIAMSKRKIKQLEKKGPDLMSKSKKNTRRPANKRGPKAVKAKVSKAKGRDTVDDEDPYLEYSDFNAVVKGLALPIEVACMKLDMNDEMDSEKVVYGARNKTWTFGKKNGVMGGDKGKNPFDRFVWYYKKAEIHRISELAGLIRCTGTEIVWSNDIKRMQEIEDLVCEYMDHVIAKEQGWKRNKKKDGYYKRCEEMGLSGDWLDEDKCDFLSYCVQTIRVIHEFFYPS